MYTTTTFRPVSSSPISTVEIKKPSPQRTRKLETPLHFDGGLFSDITSADGKVLSKVTVDRVQRSTRHDVTNSPSVDLHDKNPNVDDIIKTETITNEDVITVKFTPIPLEIDSPRLLTPLLLNQARTPIELIKNDYEDLQSYKIVGSLCKEKMFEPNKLMPSVKQNSNDLRLSESAKRDHSPLANFLVSEHLIKIDNYLQESLNACSQKDITDCPINNIPLKIKEETDTIPNNSKLTQIENHNILCHEEVRSINNVTNSYHDKNNASTMTTTTATTTTKQEQDFCPITELFDKKETSISSPTEYIKENQCNVITTHETKCGRLRAYCNMPIHYHAAILCFLLVVYNFVYQYIKQNYHIEEKVS